MQLACVLHMVPGWKTSTTVRVFMCIESKSKDAPILRRQWEQMLHMLRIDASIHVVVWDHITSPLDRSLSDLNSMEDSGAISQDIQSSPLPPYNANDSPTRFVPTSNYLFGVNTMIQEHSHNTGIVFLYLPPPPADRNDSTLYHERLEILTRNLPPTLLVHGINPVTSTTL